MELIEGDALDALIRRESPLARERALELAIGIAEALLDVHEAGIVHRDVEPGNIGVCRKGPVEVRLLDFGLATSTDERFGSRITESKRVVGSMPYMAPEQFHGHSPSPRVDLWALGIVLYEMLCGKRPFDAPTTAALIQRILTEPPPPLPMDQDAGLLRRLLAKDPALRPQSAAEVVELLEEALAHPGSAQGPIVTAEATPVEPAPAPRRAREWKRPLGIGLAEAGLLALGATFGTWLTDRSDEARRLPPMTGPGPAAEAPTESRHDDSSPNADRTAPSAGRVGAALDRPATSPHPPDAGADAGAMGRTGVPGEGAASAVEAGLVEAGSPGRPQRARVRQGAAAPPGTRRRRPVHADKQRAVTTPENGVLSDHEPAGAWDGTIIESPSP